jgi:pyruvate carboxylase
LGPLKKTFDSLLAKLVITGQSYEDALSKLKRALQHTIIDGVETNIQFLIAVISDPTLIGDQLSRVHIKSLEEKMEDLIAATIKLGTNTAAKHAAFAIPSSSTAALASLQFKPGDAFNLELTNPNTQSIDAVHSFQIDSISTNNFPDEFVAHIQTSFSSAPNPVAIALTRKSAVGSKLRRKANPHSPTDIGSPVTGMVVEINVNEGDLVKSGQQLFVMSAMKMETVVQASQAGTIKTVFAAANDLIEGGDVVVELMKDSKL